jgi:hypothetical protein
MARRDVADRTLGIELQLDGERASALGGVGRSLERSLGRLEQLACEARGLAGAAWERKAAEHAAERRTALHLRWCMEVQREAMGLRLHTDLDAWYAVPPPLAREQEPSSREPSSHERSGGDAGTGA